MGFWIFMLVVNLMIPVVMIGFGRYFMKTAPREINTLFGYRTARSMKNQDTWVFAHKYCGKIWSVTGLVMLPVTLVLMLLIYGKSEDTIGLVGGAITFAQIIPLIVAIVPTERALKKNFDENGNRR